MARIDSFLKKWASVPSQFERPTDALIDRGWAGGAAEDPPEAKWENWWHNRVDEALAELESWGALQWFPDVAYNALAEAQHAGYIWAAAKPSTGIEPGGPNDEEHWIRKSLNSPLVLSINTSSQLAAEQTGSLVLADATVALTITLPVNDSALGVAEFSLRRVDASSSTLVIAASGTDKIMLDTTSEVAGQASTELLFAGDFLRLRSDGAGKWWCVGQAQLPGSISCGLVDYSIAGSYTFTVPAVLRSGRRRAKVTVVGAGGSGRSVSGSAASAGGGAAGGKSIKLVDLTGVASVSVTVGAGGTAVIPPAGTTLSGNAGGTSSFGPYHSATGGAGGISGSSPGGIGIGGDINATLGGAQGAQMPTSISYVALPGAGVGGGSANTPNSTNNGEAGTHPGAGGGGCLTTSGVARSSGAGADGQVTIEW